MITHDVVKEAVDRLVKAYSPMSIYLYGSYLHEKPDWDDDLNMLVVVESSNQKAYKRSHKAFDALLGLDVPTNITVFTKEEFDTFSRDVTSLTHEVKTKGKVVYARGE